MGDLTLWVICGLEAEAQALGPWRGRVTVRISGADADRAEAAAREAIAAGARHLVSWGIAGGLDPALAPGALVHPGAMIDTDGTAITLASGDGALAGSDVLVNDPAAKAALYARTGAIAVDMESHRVARVAEAAGVPCTVVRTIADPAGRALPALAAGAVDARGRPRVGKVLLGLLRRPGDFPALLDAKRDSDRALAALSASVDRIFDTLAKDAL